MIKLNYININNYKKIISVPPHVHNCYEIVYFYNGNGKSLYKDIDNYEIESGKYIKYLGSKELLNTEISFAPNTFIIYRPSCLHNEEHTDPCKIMALGFSIVPTDDSSAEYDFGTQVFHDYDFLILKYINLIESEYTDCNYNYKGMIESYIFQILTHSQRFYKNSQRSSLELIKTYIDQYYMTNINFERIAEQSGYCSDYFRIQFKNKYSVTPKAYLLQKRIEFACEQLSAGDLPLNLIASNCGFDNYNQFVVFFKSRMKQTPTDYRKAHPEK